MADAVTKKTLVDDAVFYAIILTNVSDGTGESAVVKADKSAIAVARDGAEAASLDLVYAKWSCVGMQVRLLWDHNVDDLMIILDGQGEENFGVPTQHSGGKWMTQALADPRSTNTPAGTGDVLLTTVGHTSGDTYYIKLVFEKNPD